jgi:hypothetical protein
VQRHLKIKQDQIQVWPRKRGHFSAGMCRWEVIGCGTRDRIVLEPSPSL